MDNDMIDLLLSIDRKLDVLLARLDAGKAARAVGSDLRAKVGILTESGYSAPQIAKILNCSISTVSQKRKQLRVIKEQEAKEEIHRGQLQELADFKLEGIDLDFDDDIIDFGDDPDKEIEID